jgi:hypothetical protein
MFKIKRYKDAASNYVSFHATKHLGLKLAWDTDGNGTKGVSGLIWYGRKSLSYRQFWVPIVPNRRASI